MAKVSITNLASEPRTNVLNLISDSSNVADPVISSAGFRKWIYSREPDTKASDFKGYPFIIVHAARFLPETTGMMSGKKRFATFVIQIEIVSSDRGYGGSDGKGLTHNDAVTDDVLETLMDLTNRATLKSYGMSFSQPSVSSINVEPLHNELTYRRSIDVEFNDLVVVSS